MGPKVSEEKRKEDKHTRIVKFDERRKLLVNINTEEKDTELGKVMIRSEGEYHEEGIKKILSDLTKRKGVIQKDMTSIREMIEEPPKMTPELQEIENQLKKLQLINHHKKKTPENKKKEEEKLKELEEEFKKINTDINEIKKAIGGRLKL